MNKPKGPLYFFLALCLAAIMFFTLLVSINKYPLIGDEVIYYNCARSFIEWVKTDKPFQKEVIERYWNIAGEHPSAVKAISGVTWAVFHGKMGDLASLRLATAITFSTAIVILYLLGRVFLNGFVSLCSCVFLVFIPVVFKYAHFAEININLVLFWLLAVLFFFKSLNKGKFWIILSGVFTGISIGAKITSLVLPAAILIWFLIYDRKKLADRYPLFLITGLIAYLITWPLIFFDPFFVTVGHIKYFSDNLKTITSISMARMFTDLYSSLSLGLIILFGFGVVKILRNQKKEEAFFLIAILMLLTVSVVVPFRPADTIRYFIPIMPFFVIICGLGLEFIMKPLLKG